MGMRDAGPSLTGKSGKPMRPVRLPLLMLLLIATGPHAQADPPGSGPAADRVLLVPLNLAIRAEPRLEPGLEPVWQALVEHFQDRNPRPASLARESANALWNAAQADARKKAGAQAHDVYASYARFARRVAKHVHFGSIVIPSLVERAAKVHGHQAAWDGIRRMVETPRLEGAGVGIRSDGIDGVFAAASLHVAVLDPAGKLLFEGVGGLALLQRPELVEEDGRTRLQMRDDPDAFSNAELLREGVAAAFENPLRASRAR